MNVSMCVCVCVCVCVCARARACAQTRCMTCRTVYGGCMCSCVCEYECKSGAGGDATCGIQEGAVDWAPSFPSCLCRPKSPNTRNTRTGALLICISRSILVPDNMFSTVSQLKSGCRRETERGRQGEGGREGGRERWTDGGRAVCVSSLMCSCVHQLSVGGVLSEHRSVEIGCIYCARCVCL